MKARGRWLAIAIVLFALLYALAPGLGPSRTRPEIEFPNMMREQDFKRLEARQTLLPPALEGDASSDDAVNVPRHEVAKIDPLLIALPPSPDTAVVLEAKTLLASPAGKLFIDCVSEGEMPTLEGDGYSYDSLERVAFAVSEDSDQNVMLLTGPITKHASAIAALRDHTASPYGQRGQILEHEQNSTVAATWNGEMTMVGSSRAALEQAIDRLEGRVISTPPLEESQSYGDIYGRISSRAMGEILTEAVPGLTLDPSLRLDFHVDANKDVLLVLDAAGGGESTRDLGKTLAAAIAARRVTAAFDDDQELAELLDYFKVDTELGWFSLNAALPLAFVEEALADCTQRAQERRKARAARADGGAPAD